MKKHTALEFRYYNMPTGSYILPLYGDSWRREYGWDTGDTQHFHNYFELGFCHEGKGEVRIEDRVLPYSGGMYTMIPAHIPHTTKSASGNQCYWEYLFVDIDGFLGEKLQMDSRQKMEYTQALNHRGTIRTMKNHPQAGRLVLKILDEFRQKKPYYEEAVNAAFYALIIEMLRLDIKSGGVGQGIRMNSSVEMALQYMGSHYSQNLKAAQISRACGLSESHFRRTFEEVMGVPPMDYLNLIRIKNACTLINEQNLTMGGPANATITMSHYIYNKSFLYAVVQTLLAILICSLAGYGFELYHSPSKDRLFGVLLLAMMVPQVATMIPLFRMIASAGLLNSVCGFILPTLSTPFLIMLFRQNSRNFPRDIMAAARLDGLSELQIYFRMYMPVMKATYAAAGVITFMNAWNAYLWPKVVMTDNRAQTMPMLIASLASGYTVDYGLLMIGVLFCTVPTLLVFFVLQRQFAEGITGAVK